MAFHVQWLQASVTSATSPKPLVAASAMQIVTACRVRVCEEDPPSLNAPVPSALATGKTCQVG